MKIAMLTAVLSLALAFAAHAAEPLAPVQTQLYTCALGHGAIHRVADSSGPPHECCTAHSRCIEFLSTSTVEQPHHDQHT